jgi:uncharacterized DUF497 family protein
MFEWSEEKRQEVLEKHGVDVLYAALIFEGITLTRVDDREDYGETRFISLGLVEDVPCVVVHTRRGDNIRLITAWKGGRAEYERYKKSLP